MPSIADRMLAAGCVPMTEATHGEAFTVLSGTDAGQVFTGVVEIEQDMVLDTDMGADPRAKRVVRFRNSHVPRLASTDAIEDDAGQKWKCVKQPGSAFLTTDFELIEISTTKDT